MCEFYDHDTRMAREQELIAAIAAGTPREELIAKLQAEADESKAKVEALRAQTAPALAEQSAAIEAQWMAEDLIEFVVAEFETVAV